MKKILVLFLMLFGVGQVSALEYSDYSEFSEYTDRYIKGDDLTDVKVERRYKYYKFEKELGGYGEDTTLDYPYIDKEDFIYTEYSGATLDKPEIKEGRIIETVLGHHYSKIKDINYIKLEAQMASITLADIEVLYKGEKIEYELELNNANDDFKIEQGGYIKFNFLEDIDIRYITVSFDFISRNNKNASICVRAGRDQEDYSLSFHEYVDSGSVFWKGINIPGYASSYEDYYSEENSPIGRACNHIEDVTLYKYKDIMYRNYNLIKIYYDDYLSDSFEDYIYKDDLLYKDFYSFRVRTIIPEKIIEEAKSEPINVDVSTNKLNDNSIYHEVLDKTQNVYKIPEKAIYYPVNINKIEDLKEVSIFKLIYPFIFIFITLVILILVLSKLYKKKKECVTV